MLNTWKIDTPKAARRLNKILCSTSTKSGTTTGPYPKCINSTSFTFRRWIRLDLPNYQKWLKEYRNWPWIYPAPTAESTPIHLGATYSPSRLTISFSPKRPLSQSCQSIRRSSTALSAKDASSSGKYFLMAWCRASKFSSKPKTKWQKQTSTIWFCHFMRYQNQSKSFSLCTRESISGTRNSEWLSFSLASL